MKIESSFIQKQNVISRGKQKEPDIEIKDKTSLSNKALIIAHRGSSKLAPENTMASFKRLLNMVQQQ
jgi:glycerophosphoryl diester phosphodiesterase